MLRSSTNTQPPSGRSGHEEHGEQVVLLGGLALQVLSVLTHRSGIGLSVGKARVGEGSLILGGIGTGQEMAFDLHPGDAVAHEDVGSVVMNQGTSGGIARWPATVSRPRASVADDGHEEDRVTEVACRGNKPGHRRVAACG